LSEGKKSEELIDEAHENLQEDRKRLTDFAELLNKAAAADPTLAPIALAENVAKIADCLTRQNAQIVELAKLRAKKEFIKDPKGEGFSASEADTMFDEIEGQVQNDSDDDDEAN
jgi:hypothetical protein